MASSSLPLIFPAAQLDEAWHGDGGIRLTAPLSPAINLGADRIIAISTSIEPGQSEAEPSDEGVSAAGHRAQRDARVRLPRHARLRRDRVATDEPAGRRLSQDAANLGCAGSTP